MQQFHWSMGMQQAGIGIHATKKASPIKHVSFIFSNQRKGHANHYAVHIV
jgi:hypothetical protein